MTRNELNQMTTEEILKKMHSLEDAAEKRSARMRRITMPNLSNTLNSLSQEYQKRRVLEMREGK